MQIKVNDIEITIQIEFHIDLSAPYEERVLVIASCPKYGIAVEAMTIDTALEDLAVKIANIFFR